MKYCKKEVTLLGEFKMRVIGARGSACVSGYKFKKYGCGTSCLHVTAGKEHIILDAGSGLMSLSEKLAKVKDVHILLSHFHIDHICGIFACPMFYDSNKNINIYAKMKNGKNIDEVINGIMHEPYWPVGTQSFTANVNYINCNDNFKIGDVQVKLIEDSHPGGVTIYRLEYNSKSIVYATDCEIYYDNIDEIAQFAQDCELLICDGQYKESEIFDKIGFGHSSWERAVKLAEQCSAKQLMITHHDILRTDKEIDEMQKELQKVFKNGCFAYEKEEKLL